MTDSVDDHVEGTAPDTLRYQEIRYDASESRWLENDGTDYIARVEALERMPPNSLIGILCSTSLWRDSDRILRVDRAGTTTMVAGSSFASWDAIGIELLPSDSDGDGLLDDWERNGLDVNLDGTIDLDLPALGADPLHKDLFVEVDAMTEDLDGGGILDPGEDVPNGLLDHMAPWGTDAATGTPFNNLDAVVAAFAGAPVENPDGATGINLHILSDEDDIPVEPFPNGLNDFDGIKATRFGTRAERSDPNWPNILAAKELVYRYCLFAGTHSGGTSSGRTNGLVDRGHARTRTRAGVRGP